MEFLKSIGRIMSKSILTTIVFFLLLGVHCPAGLHAESIILDWNPPSEGPVPDGYRVYFGYESGSYDYYVNVGDTTTYTIEDVDIDKTYYITTISLIGETGSGYSNEVVWEYEPRTLLVDDNGSNDPGPGDPGMSDPWEDGSSEHPFDSIQEALDSANDGDTVVVRDGSYSGTGNCELNFQGKAVVLTSESGPRNTTIDCDGMGRAFRFLSGEASSTVVDGFTIRNGLVAGTWPENCGGAFLFNNSSSPTISDCLIVGNIAEYYGGAVYCVGASDPEFRNCVFSDNYAGTGAGAILVWSASNPLFQNCTITLNSSTRYGGILCGSAALRMTNSILWANSDDVSSIDKAQLTITSSVYLVKNSCIQDSDPGDDIVPYGTSLGNSDDDPMLYNPRMEDFRLLAQSPCIDVGTPLGAPESDIYGVSRPLGEGVDLGACESTCTEPMTFFVEDCASSDPGKGTPDISDPLEDGSLAHPFDSIQEAIDMAIDGDEIIVFPGFYSGDGNKNIDPRGKAITIKSFAGPWATIIDCKGSGRAFTITSSESRGTVIKGFRMTNGYASGAWPNNCGGAILIMNHSNPTIRECVLTSNSASYYGGAMYAVMGSSPLLLNCLVTRNTAGTSSGGILMWDSYEPEIMNCTIAANSAPSYGGLLCSSEGLQVTNSILWGNNDLAGSGQRSQILVSARDYSVSYSCIQDADANDSSVPFSGSAGNTDDDPLFYSPETYDFRLTGVSPCVDMGRSACAPTIDVRGVARPDGEGIDMGAHEYTSSPYPVQ